MKLSTIIYTVLLTSIQHSMCESGEGVVVESTTKQVKSYKVIANSAMQNANEVSHVAPKSKRPRPPQYMNYLLEQFEAMFASTSSGYDSKRGRSSRPTHKKLFNAWLPTEIHETEDSHRATVTFQQTMPKSQLGNFIRSQITLTLRDDVEELQLPEKTTVSMNIHWDENGLEQELIQTQSIKMDKKFYSFNITEFISSCLQEDLTLPYLVNISFHVVATQGRAQMLDFERLFDVQVDLPIIVYFYRELLPAEMNPLKGKSRKHRSITEKMEKLRKSRPQTQCQRREFLVTPEEIQLPNILGPKALDLGYCSGSCQYPLLDGYYNYTMHSFLIDRFRMERTFDVPKGFPQSSCVPISYKPLFMVEEVGPDRIEGEIVENMSVETCGCR